MRPYAWRLHLLAEQDADRNGRGVVDFAAIWTALRWSCQSSSASNERPKATIATSTSPLAQAWSIPPGGSVSSRRSRPTRRTWLPRRSNAAMASALRGWSGRSARITRAGGVAQEAFGDGQPDFGRAAEDEDGLGVAHGVKHHLEKLQTSGHVGGEDSGGVTLADLDPFVDSRIHGVEGLRGGPRVLGGVEAAAEFEHPPVESVTNSLSPALMGKSTQTFQPESES